MNKNITFLGDSLTQWGNWSELFPGKSINNLGIAGHTTTDVISRLQTAINTKPYQLFLMIGINDLGCNTNVNQVAENYRYIVNNLNNQLHQTKLFLLSLLPVNESQWSGPVLNYKNITTLNSIIQNIATEFNATYVDMYSSFEINNSLKPEFSNDGLHLNNKGYLIWKNLIEPFIEN